MATGYTHDVADGKVTDFNEFALNCARAMGVAIMMRDEPGGAIDINKCIDRSSETHHEEALAEAKSFVPKTDEEILAGFDAYVGDGIKKAEGNMAESDKKRKRYDAMLAHVNAWVSPTSEHDNYKKFMTEQLTMSIDHDCGHKYDLGTIATLKALTPERHLELSRENEGCDVEYHTKGLAEAKARNKERREWIEALLQSLGITQAERRKLSTGEDATLGNYRKMAVAVFGLDNKAVEYLDEKIAEQGPDEVVIMDEGQMVALLGQMALGVAQA